LNAKPESPFPGASQLVNLGRHLLAEFYECNANILNNVQLIENAMVEAALACGATVVTRNFHHFSPFGVSGVVVIAESHLAIHTWPEYGYAAVDLFTCGESCDPKVACEYLQEKLGARAVYTSALKRGLMNAETQTMVHSPFEVAAQTASEVGSIHKPDEQPDSKTAEPANLEVATQ